MDKKPKSNRKSTEIRQKQIIEAAERLIWKYGSEHLTVKRIANEVGISDAAIYRHFTSKKSILMFLVNHIESVLLDDLARIQDADRDQPSISDIERAIQNHFANIKSRKGSGFQIIAEIVSLGDKALNKRTAVMIDHYISKLRELLAEGASNGYVRKDIDLDATAMLLFSMNQSLVTVWAINNKSFDLHEKYSEMWDLFRNLITKPRLS